MASYDVTASVTSPPFDEWLCVGGNVLKMKRDESGNWTGSAKALNLVSPAPVHMKATGISGSPWTLKITFTPNGGGQPTNYSHAGAIPGDGLSDFQDQVKLS